MYKNVLKEETKMYLKKMYLKKKRNKNVLKEKQKCT